MMKEHYMVDYIRSIQNVLKNKNISDEDRANLNECIGSLFALIKFDGEMTKELAKELGLEFMWR